MRVRICNILMFTQDLYEGTVLPARPENFALCWSHCITLKQMYLNLIRLYPSFTETERATFFDYYCRAIQAIHMHFQQGFPQNILDPTILRTEAVPEGTLDLSYPEGTGYIVHTRR